MNNMIRSSRSTNRQSMRRPIPIRLLSFSLMLIFILITSVPGGIAQGQPESAEDPNPNAAALSTESQCFYPVADTYVAYSFNQLEIANTNYGGESTLQVQQTDAGETKKFIFLRFDLSPIPSDATIISADLGLYLSQAFSSATYILNRAAGPWQEYFLTWNNRPSFGGSFDAPVHTITPGRKSWNADQPVSDWVNGIFNNYGFVISIGGLLEGPTSFTSRDAGPLSFQTPRLCVKWTIDDLNTDLEVIGLEVTQAVQDLNNSVRLVAGKPTYVRLHVRSIQNNYRTFARLSVTCDNYSRDLYPINPGTNGYIVVRETPSRNVQNHAFLFLLPSECTNKAQQIRLLGEVNPITIWRGAYPPESNFSNNWIESFVSFETAPQLDTIVYLADYETIAGDKISTPTSEAYVLRSWLARVFPIADITMLIRTIDLGKVTFDSDGEMTNPTSAKFNAELAAKRSWDLAQDNPYESTIGDEQQIRYYGIIDDSGVFMRGSATSLPGNIASGPTGDGRWAWDTDGSYGDWYGGHEIAHTLGRSHVNCSGNEGGPDANYPHTGGLISTETTGDDAFFGFDIGNLADGIYGPNWSDNLSYCAWQWISDYTTHGILDYMQNNFTGGRAARAEGSHLQVVGTIDTSSGLTTLKPLFVLPDVVDTMLPIPGVYDIILYSSDGSELASYAFTPVHMDPGPASPDAPLAYEPSKLLISEMVPFVSGTNRVVIEGPSGVLAEVSAGSASPSVTVISPNGGENVTSDPIIVSWNASDPDIDDQLAFSVEFSPDNGATWEIVAHGISGNQIEIPRRNLSSTDYQGLFRVWVSDGIHTSSDTSDAGFRIPSQAPELTIISPVDGLVIASQQSLHLQAIAYSDIAGFLKGDQIRWVSVAKDGVLGFGPDLVVTDLSLGTHTIAVFADDGKRTSSDLFQVIVVADPSLLPTTIDMLQAAPKQVALQPHLGITSSKVNIDNASGTKTLNWQAINVTSWIQLNSSSGSTPDQVTISVDTTGLEPGSYSANVGFLTPDIPGGSLTIVQVAFTIPPEPFTIPPESFTFHLPLVLR